MPQESQPSVSTKTTELWCPEAKPDAFSQSLAAFKDWSNFLLVSTVAALGFATKTEVLFWCPCIRFLCIWSLALSIVLAIFTLALVPLVAEQRGNACSIYGVDAKFVLLGDRKLRLKCVCFPQHVLFLVGIFLYALGTSVTSGR